MGETRLPTSSIMLTVGSRPAENLLKDNPDIRLWSSCVPETTPSSKPASMQHLSTIHVHTEAPSPRSWPLLPMPVGELNAGKETCPIYWQMKEGRVMSWYPDLRRAPSKERDPVRRRQLFESHRHKVEGPLDTSRMRIEQGGTKVSQQLRQL